MFSDSWLWTITSILIQLLGLSHSLSISVSNAAVLRCKNPDDDTVADQRTDHEDHVEKSQHVVQQWIGSVEGFPVRIDVRHVVVRSVPTQHLPLHSDRERESRLNFGRVARASCTQPRPETFKAECFDLLSTLADGLASFWMDSSDVIETKSIQSGVPACEWMRMAPLRCGGFTCTPVPWARQRWYFHQSFCKESIRPKLVEMASLSRSCNSNRLN